MAKNMGLRNQRSDVRTVPGALVTCLTPPTSSISNSSTYKRNISNLGGLVQELAPELDRVL